MVRVIFQSQYILCVYFSSYKIVALFVYKFSDEDSWEIVVLETICYKL